MELWKDYWDGNIFSDQKDETNVLRETQTPAREQIENYLFYNFDIDVLSDSLEQDARRYPKFFGNNEEEAL